MFWMIGHLLPRFFKHLHFMPEMMEHEEIPELKKEMLELYKKFLEAQLKHIGQLPSLSEGA